MTSNMEMAEVLNNFFCLSFHCYSHTGNLPTSLEVLELQGRDQQNEVSVIVEGQIQKHFRKLNLQKSTGRNKMYARVLSELADVVTKLLSYV